MLSEQKNLRRNVGVDLCRCSVAVFADVVLVVQLGESFGQGQFVPEALVDPENQLAWRQLAGRHSGGKCSCGGFLSGQAAHWVEDESQFIECWGKQAGDAVIRLRTCACGQHPQGGTGEADDKRIADAGDDIGRTDIAHAPEGGVVL
ncbi:hypothetical protein EES42_35165 [Streptomyces sp. ADI95-17]|nr:hypothetical protein EES42_35165 [Streptomyces sp. ADI95-17]